MCLMLTILNYWSKINSWIMPVCVAWRNDIFLSIWAVFVSVSHRRKRFWTQIAHNVCGRRVAWSPLWSRCRRKPDTVSTVSEAMKFQWPISEDFFLKCIIKMFGVLRTSYVLTCEWRRWIWPFDLEIWRKCQNWHLLVSLRDIYQLQLVRRHACTCVWPWRKVQGQILGHNE